MNGRAKRNRSEKNTQRPERASKKDSLRPAKPGRGANGKRSHAAGFAQGQGSLKSPGRGPASKEFGAKESSRGSRGRSGLLAQHDRIAVGWHASLEAVKAHPDWVQAVYVTGAQFHEPQFVRAFKDALGVRFGEVVKQVQETVLSQLASRHQNIAVGLGRRPEISMTELEGFESAVLLALDEIEDPQNLGAILRTAWLLGATALIIPSHRSVELTPVVHKVASGGTEHVPVITVQSLLAFVQQMREAGYWILGLEGDSKTELWQMDLPRKVIWVVGSESSGMRKPVAKACDELVKIPQKVGHHSLNASVACAVALAETQRQHRVKLSI
ncbi:MAG: hypothetical protein COT74_07900 [Bdellovibrionales bacterium CG10_big_fil_rev_8_21_14_0_10_45_34]|nr:MAG: hypothetical protein COT74_07900 [Bdellovibrionales bacterium CG10_big_fil_rev_8_21_14_0_10_45_34]